MVVGDAVPFESSDSRKPIALWVIPVSALGGVARHVLDVARAGLPGYELVVLAPEGPLAEELRRMSVRVAVGRFGPDAGMQASIRTLKTAAARLRPAIVHSHLSYADVIVAVTPLPKQSIRVTTEHGIAGDDRVYHGNALKSKLMATVHTLRLRRFDAVIAVAQATKQAMLEKWHPKQKIQVVLNGVDPVAAVRETGVPREPLRVLALARLSPEKRIPQLIRAFQLLVKLQPDAQLIIAGVGDLDSELKRLVRELDLESSVTFPGFVDPDTAMAGADVLAQLSVWENCSYSLLDAANRGLRVVASNVGGNPEILNEHSLVDADDIAAVAVSLLDSQARATLSGWPSVQSMTGSITEIYRANDSKIRLTSPPSRVTLATNNGDVGGGEIMLLRLAKVLRELGVEVAIVAPTGPGGVAQLALDQGHQVIALEAQTRSQWVRALRRWDRRERSGLLWANGLVPGLATVGHPRRVLHLHQMPRNFAQRLLVGVTRAGARAVVVPSRWMQSRIPGTVVLPNWTEKVEVSARVRSDPDRTVLGFLGRPSISKGVDVLARALEELEERAPQVFTLLIAGVPNFVSSREQEAVQRALDPVRHLVQEIGWVEPADFLAQIDVLLVPSTWPETFGLVVVEAMSAGVPVVVSDSGALGEIAADAGYVFPAGDSMGLAKAILQARESGLQRLGNEGLSRWSAVYSPEASAGRLRSLLLRL